MVKAVFEKAALWEHRQGQKCRFSRNLPNAVLLLKYLFVSICHFTVVNVVTILYIIHI